ncbi:14539_t:CDS:1, partial [Cetraspora pellucida]
ETVDPTIKDSLESLSSITNTFELSDLYEVTTTDSEIKINSEKDPKLDIINTKEPESGAINMKKPESGAINLKEPFT